MARNEGRAARRKAEWRSSRSGRKRELERAPCEREGGRESETKRWRERLGNGVKSARDGGRRRREGEGCNSSREPVDTGTSVSCRTRRANLCCVCDDTRATPLFLLSSPFFNPGFLTLLILLSVYRKGEKTRAGERSKVF